jgi:hypothetical protein
MLFPRSKRRAPERRLEPDCGRRQTRSSGRLAPGVPPEQAGSVPGSPNPIFTLALVLVPEYSGVRGIRLLEQFNKFDKAYLSRARGLNVSLT